MLYKTAMTEEKFAEDYDCHGDSYTQDITPDQLRTIFSKIDQVGIFVIRLPTLPPLPRAYN